MKILKTIGLVCAFLLAHAISTNAQGQSGMDSTGLPGDHFSLQGALEMFKKAGSPEEFEKLINSEDQRVNNLDLNEDGETDYVRVIDKMEGNVHAFILQVPVSETESQDIAVIELEKTGDESALLQIVGDEDIYGEAVIVEPIEEKSMEGAPAAPQRNSGPNGSYREEEDMAVVINVWPWPCVRFVYGPVYRPWVSPWRWRVYPAWWRPWRPLRWHVWHPFHRPFHRHYGVVHTHRVVHAHRVYTPVRTTSVTVKTRNTHNVKSYRVTRTTKTKVTTGPKGNTKVKTTRKTTRVKKR